MEPVQDEDTTTSMISKATLLMNNVAKHVEEITADIQSILKEITTKYSTQKGISFLELKYHMLLSYLAELSFISLKKFSGHQLENSPCIERIAELRIVLDKMKPIEQKLHHQIQKLLSTVKTGIFQHDDPLRFKPNPDNFVGKESDDVPESVEEKDLKQKGVYVPPRISAMHYDEIETRQSREQKHLDKIQKRALNSNILYELKKQYDDGPEEITEAEHAHKLKQYNVIRNKTKYEEDYMLRLPNAKKQKHEARQLTMSSLNAIAKFDDISALEMEVGDMPTRKKSSVKISSKKWKKKKPSNKKFRSSRK